VAARGILYLLIFQQLGQLVRWSWGYHVLLAPAEKYETASDISDMEAGYTDDPPEDLIPGLDGGHEDHHGGMLHPSSSSVSFESGGRTPVYNASQAGSINMENEDNHTRKLPGLLATPTNGNHFPNDRSNGNMTSFPAIRIPSQEEEDIPEGWRGILPWISLRVRQALASVALTLSWPFKKVFHALPNSVQTRSAKIYNGFWEFMNPPLWAMLVAVIVASVPALQRLFFEEGSFVANSVTRAISQSGGVAVPLILVVLGANLARNTLPQSAIDENSEENKIGTKLLVASLISRMLLPTLIMAPVLAITAKFVPVSILDDPIFIIVCFLLTGAPSALQLAQICQINGVYEGVMSKLLFQSYVIWYVFLPTPYLPLTYMSSQDPPIHAHPSHVCA
jgi:predicted permease